MSILVYASPAGSQVRSVNAAAKAAASEQNGVELFGTADRFALRLREADWEADILVLAPENGGELAVLAAIPELAVRSRNVVVLPDRSPETVAAGHRLQPRYLTFAPVSGDELVLVLERMLRQASTDALQQPVREEVR
jgi:hypothetical protein